MLIDPKCFELAEHFLDGKVVPPIMKQSLAESIQDAVEDWLEDLESDAVEQRRWCKPVEQRRGSA